MSANLQQANNELNSLDDVQDFIRGLTLLGTGGGGRPEAGLAALEPLVRAGARPRWTSLDSLPDNGTYCALAGLGSIAPTQPLSESERMDLGYPAQQSAEQPMVRALRALESQIGKRIDGIYPIELGAGNSTTPLAAAMALGIPMLDCDCAGRAIPEMSQSSVARAGIPFAPAAFADHWGTGLTVPECHGGLLGERLGKAISTVTKAADMRAQCARAAFLVDGATLKRLALPGGLTWALKIGRVIASARRTAGADPVQAACTALGGRIVGSGKLVSKVWETREGYMYGELRIANGSPADELRIWLKNENHIVWRGERVLYTSPDLICVVDAATAEPYTNTNIQEGMQVSVLAAPASPVLRTQDALKALGPTHYGFDIPYIPFEELR